MGRIDYNLDVDFLCEALYPDRMKDRFHQHSQFGYLFKCLFSPDLLTPQEVRGRKYIPLLERSYHGLQKYITLSSGKICYIEKGEGPPLLLLHGLGANISRWNATIEALSEHYRVIAYDHPGFGKSDKPRKDYSIPWLSQILTEFIVRLDLHEVAVVGHSMGGAILLHNLIEENNPIRHAIVVSPASIHAPYGKVSQWLVQLFLKTNEANRLLPKALAGCVAQRTETVLDMLFHAAHIQKDPEWPDLQWSVTSATKNLLAFTLKDRLSLIKKPLLIVWGEEDTLQPPNLALGMHKSIPAAQLEFIPHCGHFPMLECPEIFHQKILSFLEGKNID
ncbi:MAG: hypothetical protein A3F89_00320 [Deltaproteobacteria bacterium RIFCSPLOWO2_12_FULL_50_11]|nr:MAG: hypothetical protein A3F89_00320 [Deltaproteobacteria bacterium RIFCSPLOWO2_12_FULL_50_11]